MPTVAAALVPVALLIALGVALKRAGFLPDAFWPGLDRLNYWLLFPALIFLSLANADAALEGAVPVALAIWAGLAAVAFGAMGLRRARAAAGPAYTSVFQGAIRFNSYVAFLVVPVLHPGSEALTALCVALTVPVVNVLCVAVLARDGAGEALRTRQVLTRIATNPLIVASVLGAAAGRSEVPLGPFAAALSMLGEASLAAGLLSVGATLRFRSVRASWRSVAASTAAKFVALPLVTGAVALALGLEPERVAPVVLFQALPTASASYVLARAMRGDETLMASILAVQTVAAAGWLPLVHAVTSWLL